MTLGILFIAAGLLVVGLIAIDRAYTASARRLRARHACARALDHAAYWRLHARYTALCSAGTTVEQAAAQAEQLTCLDRPIPYDVVDPADRPSYLPVWTSDGAAVAEYAELARVARTVRGVTG